MKKSILLLMLINVFACAKLQNDENQSVKSNLPVLTLQQRQDLVWQSMQLLGTPYRWGGMHQDGFDCSGLVQYVYHHAIQFKLPRTAQEMAAMSHRISLQDLKIGDLVFFNTSGKGISHVGIYIGEQRFIHAPSSGKKVQIERLDHPYYAKRWVQAGRISKK